MLSFVGENTAVVEGPSVAIVIPNWNGVQHLPDCLDSLECLEYPRERYEVILVDNGSTDSSLELVEREYPWVRVIEQSENLGFAAASNAGARAASAECVAFLNNDMRVDPKWLTELVAAYDPDAGYVCVAGTILSWDGTQIDFVDGRINFHGAPSQEHVDLEVDEALIEDLRDLPFACGGAMLISREVFLDLGGFDPAFFAYCEDVDLGWRLWVTGYKVRLAARSRSFHRRHGTGSTLPRHQRQVLYERNTLFSLMKNVGDDNFAPLLSAALFLLVQRSLMLGRSDRRAYDVGSDDRAETEVISRAALAGLHGVSDVLGDLEDVLAKRREIQRRRKRGDAEVFELFRRPFAPVFKDERYLEASIQLRGILGLDQLFSRRKATHLLVVARSGSERLRELARSASALTEVVLASSVRSPTLRGITVTPIRSDEYLGQLLFESDLVIVEAGTDRGHVIAQQTPGLLVVDLADHAASVDRELLRRADVFFCRSDEERARWSSLLAAAEEAPGVAEAPRVVVVPNGDDGLPRELRAIIQEPWHWQRHRPEIALPEDLRMLLATWRARSTTNGVGKRLPRALWSRLPEPAQRVFLKLLPPSLRAR